MAPDRIRLSELTKPTQFDLAPDNEARVAIADRLEITAIKKLRFSGALTPEGDSDWRLEAMLGATVIQPCVSTLDPVTTRLDEKIVRRYLSDPPQLPEGDEIEMPEDETIEPLPDTLDLDAVMEEALALSLPIWPRAAGVDPVDMRVSAPGVVPLSDDDAKPFSSLNSIRDRLGDKSTGNG